jgi:molybdenum cofactor biosynthesis enzyme MoaA
LDAGTRETFKKIKGIDAFARVCENLRRYAEHGNVEVKYIFMNGVNDSNGDIEGFADACNEINAASVFVTRDLNDYNTGYVLSDANLEAIAKIYSLAAEKGLYVSMSPLAFRSGEYERLRCLILAADACGEGSEVERRPPFLSA